MTDTRPQPAAAPTPSAPLAARGLRVLHRDGPVVHHGPATRSAAGDLDLLVETACELLDVDYAGVHLVGPHEHHVVATSDAAPHDPLPRLDSFCGVLLARHVEAGATDRVDCPHVVEVRDTALDPGLPAVALTTAESAPVRFYAATPLTGSDGRVVGTLCVIAHHPRSLTDLERRTLLLLGVAASTLLAGCSERSSG